MPRNGSGTYALPAGNPVTTGTTISSTWANSTLTDIGTALTNSLSKDGQTTPTGNIPMGTFKFTNLGAGSAATDSLNLGQAQNSAFLALGSVTGTDTITATASPTLTAYAAGQTFRFVSAGANTGAVTLNVDTLGAKSVTKLGTTALAAGDIPSGAVVEVYYDGTRFQLVNLAAQTAQSVSVIASSVTGTTQSANDNSTKISTTAYADNAARNTAALHFDVGASVAGNALTVTLNPCIIAFRSTTLTTGTPSYVNVSAQISMTVSSGSTLGTVNATAARLCLIAINNAGTAELAIINISGGNQLDETNLISTTAEGGAGAADSATVFYSTTARTNVAYRVVGFIDITEATAGTWATAPTLVQSVGGQAFTAMSSLGYGQTWQTVTRVLATTYYNTTGRPIMVSAIGTGANGAGAYIGIVVDGVSIFGSDAAGATQSIATAIVPPGKSYLIGASNGSFSGLTCRELR